MFILYIGLYIYIYIHTQGDTTGNLQLQVINVILFNY